MRWFSQLLSWVSTIIVARILTPADYGIVSMAQVFIILVSPVAEFGIGTAIMRDRTLSDDDVSALGGLVLLLGLGVSLMFALAASPIASFYREPALRWVAIAYAGGLVGSTIRVMPTSLLLRDLKFKAVARIGVIESVVQVLVVLLLAIVGLGYWALVVGYVAREFLGAAMLWSKCPHRLAFPRAIGRFRPQLAFGAHLTTFKLATNVYLQADFALIGRVLGSAVLGAYSFGWQLANLSVERVSLIIQEVTEPLFAQVQDDTVELSRYVLRLTEGLALVTFPLSFGAAVVADDLVRAMLGPQWESAILPLRLLACYAGVRSLLAIPHNVLIATGHAKIAMNLGLLNMVILPPLFYLATKWGAAGVAAVWLIGLPFPIYFPKLLAASRIGGFRIPEYLTSLLPAASASLIMVFAVVGLRELLPADWHAVLRLSLQVAAGAAAYLGAVALLHRERAKGFVKMIKTLRE